MKSLPNCSGIFKSLLCVGILLFSTSGRAAAQVPRFVYVANRESNNVSAYAIDAASGALTPVAGSPFAAGSLTHGVAVDPSGKFVYVANFNSRNVSAYTIDATTGKLTPVPGSPFAGSGSFLVAVDPSGKFVYVTNFSGSNSVSAYSIDATTGALTPVAGSPFAAGTNPSGVAVDPSGRFVYVGNYDANSVSAYAIDASSGALTPVAGSPFAAGTNPYGVKVDPTGQFVYVADFGSNTVSAYTIDNTSGALTPVAGSPFTAGTSPFGVAVDPSGRFLYATNEGSNSVSAYTIDAGSGALTPVAGSPFTAGTNPFGVAADPAGRFVYVVNYSSNNVSAYSIDSASGALTPVPGSPFAAGPNPYGVAVTPACVPAPSGLVSWWRGEGNADDSADGNFGTLQNGATFAAGKVGQAFSFDGADDYVEVPHHASLDIGTGFTFDAWIKADNSQANQLWAIVDKAHHDPGIGWTCHGVENVYVPGGLPGNRATVPGEIFCSVGSGGTFTLVGTQTDVKDGQFHHIALAWTGAELQMYLDGVLKETNPLTGPVTNNTDPLRLGQTVIFDRPFRGLVDEAEFFNRALTSFELQRIFNAGPKGKCPCVPPPSGLVGWWPGEGHTNDIIGDANGSIVGNVGFSSGKVAQAFDLPGVSNNYIDFGDSPALNVAKNGDFTVTAWAYPRILAVPSGNPNFDVVTKLGIVDGAPNADGWRVWFSGPVPTLCVGNGYNGCGGGGPLTVQGPAVSPNAWTHIAALKQGNVISIYVNGMLGGSQTIPGYYDSGTPHLVVGSSPTESTFFDGIIDEVQLFNRALSASEIQALFDSGGAGTCRPRDLTCSKTASTSFDRTFTWNIQKTVDKTTVKRLGGGTATFNYTVNASQTGAPADSDWMVTGAITVTNPNDFKNFTGVNITDAIDNGGSCVVAGGSGATVPAAGLVELPYACTYSSAPSPFSGINTATAAWDASAHLTAHAFAQGMASFAFGDPANIFKQNVTVTDTFNSVMTTLGSLTGTTSPAFASSSFTYSHTVTVPQWGCTSYANTALIVQTSQSSDQTVQACGPVKTGAKSIGFWQNKTGQDIIKTSGSTSGVCNLTPWLRQFAPFQALSATASCNAVATYVSNVIKAANASGASMNAALKGQMLASALDVYFSDPGLGGNRIGAPAPVGGVTIDLTLVCNLFSFPGGVPTCTGAFQNTSSAFGGATSLTVSQMLAFAASQSNAGGTSWYANVKSVQQLAKNAFNAVNNEVAFAP